MTAWKLFVSHSSEKDDRGDLTPTARDFLLQLCDGLSVREGGFRVLVDQGEAQGRTDRIPPGADWDRLLDEWMAECHAAVLLLDARALASPWVRKEAAILTWRWATDPDFLVIPVLLQGLRPEILEADPFFKAIGVKRIQAIKNDNAETIAGKVRRELEAHFRRIAGRPTTAAVERTPFERLARAVGLRLSGVDPRSLPELCTRLGIHTKLAPYCSLADSASDLIARYILRNHLNSVECALTVLRELGEELTQEAAKVVLQRIRPLWVQQEEAARLPAASKLAELSDTAPMLALRGKYLWHYTAECYFGRAFTVSDLGRWIPASDATHRDDIEDALLQAFDASEYGKDMARADVLQSGEPVFMLVPRAFGLPEVLGNAASELAGLQQRYPNVVFVVADESEGPSALALRPGLQTINPALTAELEAERFAAYRQAKRWIKKLPAG